MADVIAFFLSGASSLIFQMIWSRLLHHVFGSSSVAISSVVSVFMGGLALGAWLFGRYADRIQRPLLIYAFAELGVGAFALVLPWLVDPEGWLAGVNATLRLHFGSDPLIFALARFACIVLVVLGHAVQRLTYDSDIALSLYLLIYAFHMPAFAVISGYFSKSDAPTKTQMARVITDTLSVTSVSGI